MTNSGRWVGAVLCAAMLISSSAAAQEARGFALNRFEPAERGSEWFANESLDFRGHERFALGLILDYGRKPLVLYDENGDEVAPIVSDQFFGHLGMSAVVLERFRFSLNLPVALIQDGETGQAGGLTFSSDNQTTTGDLRVTGDARVLGEYRDPITLAAGLRVYAPTGSRDSFTGDGAFRAAVRFMGAGQVQKFFYAASLAFDFRAQHDDFAGSPTGSQANFTAAAGLSLLQDKLTVGPEVFGSTVVTDSDAVFARRTTPLELLFGGHYEFHKGWRVGAGVGPGLTRGFGTPQLRVLASITRFEPFEPPAPPPLPSLPPPVLDRDGDGINDVDDACPDDPGVANDDPAKHGCPPPPDRDGDLIIDAEDACPDEPGDPNDDPAKNGCPPPKDRDGDSIVDPEDACPDEPGIPTDDPKTNGCPDPDRDKDGIENEPDACPDAAGPANDDPKKHGCPVARVERGQIVIREQVQFAYNSDRILKASDTVMEAVYEILEQNPHITKVEVQGHTDSKGSDAYNKALSKRRAASVMKWLTKKGIAKDRLQSVGYGEEKPIADNETEEGRADNRRVEFHIIEQGAAAEPEGKAGEQPAPEAPKPEADPKQKTDKPKGSK